MAHRLSCGIIPVRDEDGRPVTLMLRAFQYWDFPKGLTEEGEEPLATAVRELAEETGIRDAVFEWGERFLETGPYSRGKVARYYIARTATADVVMGLSPVTGQPEHHEWRWLSFDEAYDLSSPRVRDVVRWARQIVGA